MGGDVLVAGLNAIVTSARPDSAMVDRGRAYLRQRLPAELDAYVEGLAQLAEPLADVVAGRRMADLDDRLQAVRFTLALHGLEAAILEGTLGEDAVDNALYMRYAQLEEALEAALPPRPGFSGRPQAPAPAPPVRENPAGPRGSGGSGGPPAPF